MALGDAVNACWHMQIDASAGRRCFQVLIFSSAFNSSWAKAIVYLK